jgi:hypothetical protein
MGAVGPQDYGVNFAGQFPVRGKAAGAGQQSMVLTAAFGV